MATNPAEWLQKVAKEMIQKEASQDKKAEPIEEVKEIEVCPKEELKTPMTEQEDVAAAKEVLEYLKGLKEHEAAEGNEPQEVALLDKAIMFVEKFLGEEEEEAAGEVKEKGVEPALEPAKVEEVKVEEAPKA